MEKVEIKIGEKIIEMDIIKGTENDRAIDISSLRKNGGVVTLDPGFQNTGSCKSAITYVNGEKGILRYRGYPVSALAEKSTPVEVAYLLVYGELPTCEQLKMFKERIADYSYLHKDMVKFFSAAGIGDMEKEEENRLLASKAEIKADILKVGHHGSNTSTSYNFMMAVSPAVAIYSAGAGNNYHHPHPSVINRLKSYNKIVYGTDINGLISVEILPTGYTTQKEK